MSGRIQLEGTKVATTKEIFVLADMAQKEGYEHQFSDEILAKLDPDGKHVVCLRPEALPGFKPEDKFSGVSKLDLTLGTPLPCEIMLKTKGTMKMVKAWLDIPVYAYNELTDTPFSGRERLARDGQRRKKW